MTSRFGPVVALPLAVFFALATCAAPAALAQDATTQASCSAEDTKNFGFNCDGWKISIKNSSDYLLKPTLDKGVSEDGPLHELRPGELDTGIRGDYSWWLGRPKGVHIRFTSPEDLNVKDLADRYVTHVREIRVETDSSGLTSVSCGVKVVAIGILDGERSEFPDVGCHIESAVRSDAGSTVKYLVDPTQPLAFTFSNVGDVVLDPDAKG